MNVHISYKIHKSPDIEREINHLLEKLNRRLRAFRPELVHLKGLIDHGSPREGAVVSLNLRLPSGQMAVQESGANALAALKAASDELVLQVGKHKALLRSSHKWRRRGSDASFNGGGEEKHPIPLEAEARPVSPDAPPPEDIRSYVNTHLGRLERFVERELYFREVTGQMSPDSVTKDEVVDEVVVRALSGLEEDHDRLALEPWFYRLAVQSIQDLFARSGEGMLDVRLDGSASSGTADGGTEPEFHLADEFLRRTDSTGDDGTATPEDAAYTDELISLVQFALGDVSESDRGAFILDALEGFSVVEIAAITDRKPDEIRSSISAVRKKLRQSTRIQQGFREKRLQRTGTD
ncbi:MAG: RNA polymerase sigma factor [Terriglobales bacterium]